MEIKFTVPGPPKGQRDVASMSHTKKARAMSLLPALKLVAICQRGLRADLEYVRLMGEAWRIHQSKQSNTKDS